MPRRRLGDLLLEAGLVSREHLQMALDRRRHTGERLGQALISLGYLREDTIAKALAEQLSLEYLESADETPACAPPSNIGEGAARRYRIVPVAERAGRLTVATADPLNVYAAEQLSYLAGRPVDVMVCTDETLDRILDRYYPRPIREPAAERERPRIASGRLGTRLSSPKPYSNASSDERAGPALAWRLLLQANDDGASELHLEPTTAGGRVRMRCGGLLRETMVLGRELFAGVLAHIRSLSGLDLTEIGAAAEGWFGLDDDDCELSVRACYLRMPGGDRAVLHVVDRQQMPGPLEAAGMEHDVLVGYRRMLRQSSGLLLVAGAYESELRALLRSTVASLNDPSKLVAFLEGTPGRPTPGVLHLAWGSGRAIDARGAARAAMMQGADVVVVSGRTEDRAALVELVSLALQGKLVILGVPARGAKAALTALELAGVPGAALDEVYRGGLAHDLLPRPCPDCSTGCAKCDWSGYAGTIAAFALATPESKECSC